MIKKPRIVIIGGVAAGPAAAARAARINPDAEIILYEKGSTISYATCDLTYFISQIIADEKKLVAYSPDQFSQKKGVIVRTRHRVEKIRPVQKKIYVRDLTTDVVFEDHYDRLILATGSTCFQGAFDKVIAPNFFTLKTIENAVAIRKFIESNRPGNALVLGCGFIGLEMAEAFSVLNIPTTILHQEDYPLPGFECDHRKMIQQVLEQRGIRYFGNVKINGFSQHRKTHQITGINTDVGDFSPDLVLLAWGFRPNVDLAREAGIRLGSDGAISVDEQMRTSIDSIYAAGDCVELKHKVTGRPVYLPLASHAARTGKVAGDNAAGGHSVFKGTTGTVGLKFFDLEITRTGINTVTAKEMGFQPIKETIQSFTQAPLLPGAENIWVSIIADKTSQRLLGANIIGGKGSGLRINPIALALQEKVTIAEFQQTDFVYTPPISPLWDPVLACVNVLARRLK